MTTKQKKQQNDLLQIISLGGLGEVGRNTWVFAINDDWIVIDAGIGFPFNEFPGVEILLPDIDYLLKNQEKIKALVITHAHEDHIGGAIRLLTQLNIPRVLGSNLTISLLEKRMEEIDSKANIKFEKHLPRDVATIGAFKIEFIRTTHSVPDCFALAIDTPAGKILLTGDFKFDFTPLDGEHFDVNRIVELANEGIKLLISDSTNVERAGFSQSERTVGLNLVKLFQNINKRIFITTFSSHIHRIQQIIDAAIKVNRKVCILGHSMEVFTGIARDCGYLKYSDSSVVPIDEALKLPENEIVILTTGSQGEPTSTLAKMSRKEHKTLQVIPGDTIIFSTNPIPGNERSVSKLLDELCAQGANLVYGRNQTIHVSGHACQEELKLMVALAKPEYFLPAHGDYRMQVQHAEIGANMGIDPSKIFILSNGDMLEVDKKEVNIIKNEIPTPPVYCDNMSGGIIEFVALKDRMMLGQEGIILLLASFVNESEELVIDIIIKGVSFAENASEEKIIKEIQDTIKQTYDRMKKFGTADISNLRQICREATQKIIENKICCKPMIIKYIQETNKDK